MTRIGFYIAVILFSCQACNSAPEPTEEVHVADRTKKTIQPQHFKLKSGHPGDESTVYTAANITMNVENGADSMQTITISSKDKRLINYIRKVDTLPSPYLYISEGDTILGLFTAGKFTAYKIRNNKALLFDHFFTHELPELARRDTILEFIHHK
ncbi:hypothetical protein [Chitinophaga sp. Cy-1792]|uniref:hypothetical protein n=1 Tax=Chitinophaga sp. Cy-1792 TaxID=2608339 RepID=UPI0014214336|nr:hypothetical protein [Chitinophaga sp. Cy-1792]NIG53106.1 hypothetical protein [Chitinophaga sp. Cy-1792]